MRYYLLFTLKNIVYNETLCPLDEVNPTKSIQFGEFEFLLKNKTGVKFYLTQFSFAELLEAITHARIIPQCSLLCLPTFLSFRFRGRAVTRLRGRFSNPVTLAFFHSHFSPPFIPPLPLPQLRDFANSIRRRELKFIRLTGTRIASVERGVTRRPFIGNEIRARARQHALFLRAPQRELTRRHCRRRFLPRMKNGRGRLPKLGPASPVSLPEANDFNSGPLRIYAVSRCVRPGHTQYSSDHAHRKHYFIFMKRIRDSSRNVS